RAGVDGLRHGQPGDKTNGVDERAKENEIRDESEDKCCDLAHVIALHWLASLQVQFSGSTFFDDTRQQLNSAGHFIKTDMYSLSSHRPNCTGQKNRPVALTRLSSSFPRAGLPERRYDAPDSGQSARYLSSVG